PRREGWARTWASLSSVHWWEGCDRGGRRDAAGAGGMPAAGRLHAGGTMELAFDLEPQRSAEELLAAVGTQAHHHPLVEARAQLQRAGLKLERIAGSHAEAGACGVPFGHGRSVGLVQ